MQVKGQQEMPLGIVVERREVDHRWLKHSWKPVAVIPGAAPADPRAAWTRLADGPGWVHFHAGTLSLELFRKETEGYKVNLAQIPPRLFVVLRPGEELDSDHEVVPFLVTACPYEAQDYLDSGEEIVEPVAMPDGVVALVQGFIDEHHREEVFHKRKRRRWAEASSRPGLRSSRGPDAGPGDEGDG